MWRMQNHRTLCGRPNRNGVHALKDYDVQLQLKFCSIHKESYNLTVVGRFKGKETIDIFGLMVLLRLVKECPSCKIDIEESK